MPNDPLYTKFDHDQYARTKAPDDFWGQIRRTVNGKQVSPEQIELIIGEIKKHLSLQPNDVLLDLACGNGALSRSLFDSCKKVHGVDLSDYMISIANQYFSSAEHTFLAQGAAEYVRSESQPERFTKALCYGSFSYFSEAEEVLSQLNKRFVNISTIFIGNLPDLDRQDSFYVNKKPGVGELFDPRSQIGIWRTKNEFTILAEKTGWTAKITNMPTAFYSSHYRYDVTLLRSGN